LYIHRSTSTFGRFEVFHFRFLVLPKRYNGIDKRFVLSTRPFKASIIYYLSKPDQAFWQQVLFFLLAPAVARE
jgi:hypothetical protein